ncbi:hypothetical protein EI94DRAFT_670214 [Lactarius quietus]|nr:hypothetical protein EI94DRAFT_670214 [Lactarius quietus]
MHASLFKFATFVLVASAVVPALAGPIGYIFVLLDLSMSADLFIVFPVKLWPAMLTHSPYVIPSLRTMIKRDTALSVRLLPRVNLGLTAMGHRQSRITERVVNAMSTLSTRPLSSFFSFVPNVMRCSNTSR